MTAMQLIFLVTAMITLFSAVMTVTSRRMLHSALWLILSLLGVAVVYVLLEASFFAVVQVLVYIGAIAILILFAIMLTRKSMVDSGSQTNRGWLLVMLIIGVACAGMVLAFLTWPALTQTTTALPYDEKDALIYNLAELFKKKARPVLHVVDIAALIHEWATGDPNPQQAQFMVAYKTWKNRP